MEYFIGFLIGVILGAAIALAISHILRRSGEKQMRETFSALASEALDSNAKRVAETAGAQLESKKELIDQAIKNVNDRLEQVRKFLQDGEVDRKKELGVLGKSVTQLAMTTGDLHQMLASTQRRGAWGERMADDVLRLAGLAEGINYSKQSTADAESGRPDFTFYLTGELKVNMDVKFPLENYKAYLDAEADDERNASLQQLVKDVRGHIRAVAGRGYIDTKNGTVNYVLLFIPSEQIFSIVLEANADLIDDALKMRVVLASPLTLYAMLSVIRQAAEHANIMKTADEVITLLSKFNTQWQKYSEEVDRLGSQLDTVQKTYDNLRTTRTNMLQKPLDKIEDLRQSRQLPKD